MENKHISQIKKVAEYWKKNTASRYMVAMATDIPIQNICRYVDMLKASNSIVIVKKDYCAISRELVEYLSTNERLFHKQNQLKLF